METETGTMLSVIGGVLLSHDNHEVQVIGAVNIPQNEEAART